MCIFLRLSLIHTLRALARALTHSFVCSQLLLLHKKKSHSHTTHFQCISYVMCETFRFTHTQPTIGDSTHKTSWCQKKRAWLGTNRDSEMMGRRKMREIDHFRIITHCDASQIHAMEYDVFMACGSSHQICELVNYSYYESIPFVAIEWNKCSWMYALEMSKLAI